MPMRQYLFPRVTLRLHSATSSSSDESTPFNNGINADTSTNTPPTSASAALEKYLSQLVQRGVLSVDETQSISGALFNPNWEQIFPSEDKIDDGILRMIPESVDVYISQKMRRIETGREAIEKPGSYVRSVVKKQMELKGIEIPQNTQQLENSQNHPGINDANNDGVPTNLESILQANNVEQMDLNENCMLALIRCPIQTAKYALETYTKQQKRREMSGMDKISSPSSYIMAVLR